MADPSSGGLVGLKLVPSVAGLVGGVVALSFVQGLNRWQAVASVFTGAATAAYGQPMVGYAMGLPDELAGGVGFVLGLTGMGLAGWAVKAAADPLAVWERVRSILRGGGGS